MTGFTVLELSGVGVPPYSARGLTQTLDPIPQAIQLRRTVNGNLSDTSDDVMRKYVSTISGNDQQPPAVDGVWPGRLLVVSCIVELAVFGTIQELTEDTTEGLFGRPYVPGSVRHESGFTYYRPLLTMRVQTFNINRDEWGAVVSWTMTLEEF